MPEPVFSTVQVATLFGLAPTSSYFVVQRWIVPGLLEARRVDPKPDQDPRGIRYIVEPRAVLAFVRQHPDAYDWTKIADPLLKADAERVERRDPLVPLEEVLPSLGATMAELAKLAKGGAFTLLARGGGKRTYLIRRSQLDAIHAAIADLRRSSDPVFALHALLQSEKGVPSRGTVEIQPAPAVRPSVPPAVLPSAPGQPRPPYADRRCPRCKTQRTISQALDGYELACMNCGETEPIVDQAAEARREAKRQAEAAQLAAESRGPGRPKAVAS
jgi:hypothetical protein